MPMDQVGIGTGWSTNIPQYNPKDIINSSGRRRIKIILLVLFVISGIPFIIPEYIIANTIIVDKIVRKNDLILKSNFLK